MATIHLAETDTRSNHFDNLNRVLNDLADGAGAGGLTDAELRASPVPMVPMLNSSGNIEIVVPTADTPVQLPAQACKQVVLANNSTKPGWVIQGGKKFPLFAQAYMSFFGITNTNQLSVQLPDVGDIYAHWES